MDNTTAYGPDMQFGNATEDEERGAAEPSIIFCGVMIPFLIIGLFGHITVLLSVLFHEDLHRPLNVMIVNLSVAQFFMLIISVFGDVIVHLTTDWFSSDINLGTGTGWDILFFLTLLFSTSTSVFYGLLALNRLVSTVFESLYNRLEPWKMVWSLVVSGWILSIIAAIFPWMTDAVHFRAEPSISKSIGDTYFFLGPPWFRSSRPVNTEPFHSDIYWLVTVCYFVLPAISMIMCYTTIFLYNVHTQRLSGLPVNSPRAINLRDRARVILMLMIASGVYLLCFYSSMIYWQHNGRKSRTGRYFFLWLVFAQNALNPVIYGLVTPQFREAYRRVFPLLLRRWSCRRPYETRRVGPVQMDASVIYQAASAKNSVIFQNHLNSNLGSIHDQRGLSGQGRYQMPTSARNLELKVKELSRQGGVTCQN